MLSSLERKAFIQASTRLFCRVLLTVSAFVLALPLPEQAFPVPRVSHECPCLPSSFYSTVGWPIPCVCECAGVIVSVRVCDAQESTSSIVPWELATVALRPVSQRHGRSLPNAKPGCLASKSHKPDHLRPTPSAGIASVTPC